MDVVNALWDGFVDVDPEVAIRAGGAFGNNIGPVDVGRQVARNAITNLGPIVGKAVVNAFVDKLTNEVHKLIGRSSRKSGANQKTVVAKLVKKVMREAVKSAVSYRKRRNWRSFKYGKKKKK